MKAGCAQCGRGHGMNPMETRRDKDVCGGHTFCELPEGSAASQSPEAGAGP